MEVKCLSVKNPFAYLLCAGGKDIENRTWKTDYRGRLYIQASGEPMPFPLPEVDYPDLKSDPANAAYLEKVRKFHKQIIAQYENAGIDTEGKELYKDVSLWYMKCHAIIGYVDLIDIVKDSRSPWSINGNYHWIMANPVLLDKPIENVSGKLSIWKFNIE